MKSFFADSAAVLFSTYFYESWTMFEGATPEEVGYKFSSEGDVATTLGVLGELNVLIGLELEEEQVAKLLRSMGVRFSGVPYTFGELVSGVRSGILKQCIERVPDA